MDPKVLQLGPLLRVFNEGEIKNHGQQLMHHPQLSEGRIDFLRGKKLQSLFILLGGSVMVAKDTLNRHRLIFTKINELGNLFGEIDQFLGNGHNDMYIELRYCGPCYRYARPNFPKKDTETRCHTFFNGRLGPIRADRKPLKALKRYLIK